MHWVQRKGAFHERVVVCCIRRGNDGRIGVDAYKELVTHFIFLSNAADGCQASAPFSGDFVEEVGLLSGLAIPCLP
jgi:hypothetical protein